MTVQERLGAFAEARAADIIRAFERGIADEDAAVAVRSAEALLTRVFGKPVERVVQAEASDVESLTAEQRQKLREALLRDYPQLIQHPAAEGLRRIA